MAEASAAVGRRKASALRSARAASDDAANSFAPFGALPPLIFLEANNSCRWLPKLGCECIAGMIFHVVIAGLDPAIHGTVALALFVACQLGPPGQARW